MAKRSAIREEEAPMINVVLWNDVDKDGKQIPFAKVTNAYLGKRAVKTGERFITVKLGNKWVGYSNSTGESLFQTTGGKVPQGFKLVSKEFASKKVPNFSKADLSNRVDAPGNKATAKKSTGKDVKEYIVYTYQYVEMKKPNIDAKVYKGKASLDTLPPTVIDHDIVKADTKQEAILKSKFLVEAGKNKDKTAADKSEVKGFSWANEPGDIVVMDIPGIIAYLSGDSESNLMDDFYTDEDISLNAGLMEKVEDAKKPADLDEYYEEYRAFLELKEKLPELEDYKKGELITIAGDVAAIYVEKPDKFHLWKGIPGYFERFGYDDREKGEDFVEQKANKLANKIKKYKLA